MSFLTWSEISRISLEICGPVRDPPTKMFPVHFQTNLSSSLDSIRPKVHFLVLYIRYNWKLVTQCPKQSVTWAIFSEILRFYLRNSLFSFINAWEIIKIRSKYCVTSNEWFSTTIWSWLCVQNILDTKKYILYRFRWSNECLKHFFFEFS